MATTKKKSSSPSPKGLRKSPDDYRESPDNFRKTYVRLRTLLDAMEMGAVRYFLEGETTADRVRRAKEIERQIRPILAELNISFGAGCPPGLNNCGGCCVPYPCPRNL